MCLSSQVAIQRCKSSPPTRRPAEQGLGMLEGAWTLFEQGQVVKRLENIYSSDICHQAQDIGVRDKCYYYG